MAGMSDGVRSQVTEAAVMEAFSESTAIFNLNRDPKNLSVDELLQAIDEQAKTDKKYSKDLEKDPQIQILRDYRAQNENFGGCKIVDYKKSAYPGGEANAMLEMPGKDGGKPKCFVVYRGTAGAEWRDNAQMMYKSSTTQQVEAAKYFDDLVEKYPDKFKNSTVTVAGHSKGANKAMYVTMSSKYADYIDHCISLDGPGFSPEAMEILDGAPNHDQRINKIIQVAGSNDYVHTIALPLAKDSNTYYLKYSGVNPDSKVMAYHYNQYLFQQDKNGRFSAKLCKNGEPSDIVRHEKEFFKMYMSLSEETRAKSASTVMELLQKEKNFSPDGTDASINLPPTFFLLFEDPYRALALAGSIMGMDVPNKKEILRNMVKAAQSMNSTAGVTFLMMAVAALGMVEMLHDLYGIVETMAKVDESLKKAGSGFAAWAGTEFWVDPDVLNEAALKFNGVIGRDIDEVQRILRKHYGKAIPQLALDMIPPIPDQPADAAAVIERTKLIMQARAAEQKLRSTQAVHKECDQLLEKAAMLINDVISYMADTSTDFRNVEINIQDTASAWIP